MVMEAGPVGDNDDAGPAVGSAAGTAEVAVVVAATKAVATVVLGGGVVETRSHSVAGPSPTALGASVAPRLRNLDRHRP